MFNSYNPGYYGAVYQAGRGYTHVAKLTDEEIQGRIYDAFDDDPQIPENAEIEVGVRDAVVTLTGTVRSRNTKRAAWDCAWSIPQVRDVNNNVRIVGRREQNRTAGAVTEQNSSR